MKKSGIFIVLIFAFMQSAWALSLVPIDEIKPSLSGSWYNSLQDGHGLSVEVLSSTTTVIYWYVYNPDGTPTFLITVGENQGNVTSGTTYIQTGMKFGEFDPAVYEQTVWGTVTLTFWDCNNAELEYSSNLPQFGSGTIEMTRLASIKGLHCKSSPVQGNYSISHTVRNEETGDTVSTGGMAVLLENNEMFYWLGTDGIYGPSANLVGAGVWLTSDGEFENSFEYNATTYSVHSEGPQQVSGSGSYNQDGFKAFSDADTAFGDSETLTATPLPSFQTVLTFDKIKGTRFVGVTDIIIGEVMISPDGTVSGTVNECQLTGSIEIPNTNFNQATFDFELQNCPNPGAITGVLVADGYGLTLIGHSTSGPIFWHM